MNFPYITQLLGPVHIWGICDWTDNDGKLHRAFIAVKEMHKLRKKAARLSLVYQLDDDLGIEEINTKELWKTS